MPPDRLKIRSLLISLQEAVAQHRTNPYQIAKATGISLRSVQILLKQESNPTLANVDRIFAGLGIALYAEAAAAPVIRQGGLPVDRSWKPDTASG